jgi:F-type H+-transporting ATPase subunit delta
MAEEAVSRRYAAALFGLAQRTGTINEIDNDLTAVAKAYREVRSFRAVLGDPDLPEAKKKDALNAVFKGRIGETTLTFLNLLLDKRRFDELPEIQTEYDRLALTTQNIARATIVSAVPLSKSEADALVKSLEGKTGKRIELTAEVDPSVIGGVLVRIGDTVYDGTVRGNLERLRARLLAK